MGKFQLKKIIKWFSWLSGTMALSAVTFYLLVYFGAWGKLPEREELVSISQAEATKVLSSNGTLIGKFYEFDRESVPYESLPHHLVKALIATEDSRFYEHKGVDYKSLFRVAFKTILLGDESSGGGSTISQQLAKNLFGRDTKGFLALPAAKVKEIIIAKRLEKIYSKEKILELYFNTVPFSDNTYGIESAARKFFNKNASKLSLEEAATLVGTLKATHTYNPRLNPEKSKQRRNVVLKQMAKYGFISEEDAEKAAQTPLQLKANKNAPDGGIAMYFQQQVKKELKSIIAEYSYTNGKKIDLNRDGLSIYTTLDVDIQKLAEEAMREHLAKLQKQHELSYGKNAPWIKDKKLLDAAIRKLPEYQKLKNAKLSPQAIIDSLKAKKPTEYFTWNGIKTENISVIDSLKNQLKLLNAGFVALNPNNGHVMAYIGGVNYQFYKYDHVVQSKRQVGSTFKPIVYAAALENGMEPCRQIPVKAVTYTDADNWMPTNSSESDVHEDPFIKYSLEMALSRSVNTVAVKVMQETGIDATIATAKKLGIETNLPKVPSLALGTAELSLMEVATAYTAFVNDSKPKKPVYIVKVEDKDGNVIFEHKDNFDKTSEAFSETTRQTMLEMMKTTVNTGTAMRLRHQFGLGNVMAGKTGTTQNNKDGWFVGITPTMVAVSWVGNDHSIPFKTTSLGQGANSALPVFALLMKKMNADKKFNYLTKTSFKPASEEVFASLDCEPVSRDNFFERLFNKPEDSRVFGNKQKRKGLFSFLKRKNDSQN